MSLTEKEISHFNEQGFVIKRGVVDTDLTENLVDYYWQFAPSDFVRDDPDTYQYLPEFDEVIDGSRIVHRKYYWNVTPPEDHEYVQELINATKHFAESVEDILNVRNLGVFGIIPGNPGKPFHIDGPRELLNPTSKINDQFVGCTILLDDVSKNGGSFCVIPKSHHIVEERFLELTNEDCYLPDKNGLHECHEPPVQFTGNAGDAIIWNQYILHKHVENTSDRFRLAYFFNYRLRRGIRS